MLPPEIRERFLRLRQPLGAADLVYRPALLARVRLHFAAARPKVDAWRDTVYLAYLEADAADPWAQAETVDARELASESSPDPRGGFAELPPGTARGKSFEAFGKRLEEFLYRTARVRVLTAAEFKETSQPDEPEGDFRARLQQTQREARDLDLAKLRERYAPKVHRLQERIRNAEQAVQREQSQVRQSQLGAAVSFGTGILGALFGRKMVSASNVSRAGSAMRSVSKVGKEKADVAHAEEDVRALRDDLAALEAELATACADVRAEVGAASVRVDSADVTPKKGDLDVYELVLAWVPCARVGSTLTALR